MRRASAGTRPWATGDSGCVLRAAGSSRSNPRGQTAKTVGRSERPDEDPSQQGSVACLRERLDSLLALLSSSIAGFKQRVRRFFYEVVLCRHRCPVCDATVMMIREGRCRCESCQRTFDPTVAFQRCSSCGGVPRLRIRRYMCEHCGTEVVSRFLFDGLVFDAEYFRRKMAEHRQRQRQLRGREIVPMSRSDDVEPAVADLKSIPGLLAALDSLTAGNNSTAALPATAEFDLHRYEAHVFAHVSGEPIRLDEIPPLSSRTRQDRIWRFIAVIFLAHTGLISVRQEDWTIWVSKRETHRKGQDLPGGSGEADGVERAPGRVEV